ncbi:MAG: RusA family crossover junction endodeoxyribonuclease [Oscillospiraceae bacterium]|nr:RusA family crossover junction endodeoxyribonuclease [Oscillospiraceae bacterium]
MKDLEISFFVPGKPQGKARPRFTKDGHAYTPQNTVAYQGQIAAHYWQALSKAHETLTIEVKSAYVEIDIQARFPVPASDSKTLQLQKLSGRVRPKSKPDLDNIAKAVLDALNDFAYCDDSQVIRLTVSKRYSDISGLLVTVIHKNCVE